MATAAASGELVPDTVAERLRADDTRALTLHALEALPPPIARELALAAAAPLVDIAAGTENTKVFECCSLLLARQVFASER